MSAKGKSTTSSFIPWDTALQTIAKLEEDHRTKFALLFSIGIFTGLRISDMLTLKFETFKDAQNIWITEKKTGKPRRLTIHPDLLKIIERNRNGNKGLIFTNEQGKPLSIQYINQEFKRIAKRYNLAGNISCHSLRKTFGRHIWSINNESDAALIKLSDIFNHSSTATTRRYLGITAQEIENVYLSM